MEVGAIADWLGILGFIVTARVWWVTRGLSKAFLSRARIPEIRTDLSKQSAELLKAIQGNNLDDIGGIYSRMESSLESARSKVGFLKRGGINALKKSIKTARQGNGYDVAQVRPIYDELLGIIEFLKNVEKDVSWGGVK